MPKVLKTETEEGMSNSLPGLSPACTITVLRWDDSGASQRARSSRLRSERCVRILTLFANI